MQNLYIHSYFTLVHLGALRNHIYKYIYDFKNLTPSGGIFKESGIVFHIFGHLWQISDNWRSWLHIQKDYIHWYSTLVDSGASRKHILTNIDDFVIFTASVAILLRIWDISSPILPLVTKWGQLEIWIANAIALYQFILYFDRLWGIEEAY